MDRRGTDFNAYIQFNFPNFSDERKQSILDVTLILVRGYKISETIDFIMVDKNNELMPRKKFLGNNAWSIPEERVGKTEDQIHKEIFDRWHLVLTKYQFDFSQEIYVLLKYSELHFNALGKLFPNIDLESEEYTKGERKDLLLSAYISSKHLWNKFDEWSELLWKSINELDDNQYTSFWITHGILKGKERLYDYQLSTSKEYTLYLNKPNFENPKDIIDFRPVISRLNLRLTSLKKKGYKFNESKYR